MSLQIPQQLINSLRTVTGFDEEAFSQVHQSGEKVTSLRLNPGKQAVGSYQLAVGPKVPWSSNGCYLPERPLFTLDPLLHGGAYYVQEASSMFLEEAMKQCADLSQPLKVLDLCAAPGGKSILLQSIISDESLLVSNEVIKTRVNVLAENITKWGAANVIISNNDPQHFQRLTNYFDVLVVDAPCSGSGLFRRDPAAIEEWSENNVQLCSQRQQRILADVMPSLKENGLLIYSTCSYSREEDEEMIEWVMSNCSINNIRLQLRAEWGIVETMAGSSYGYRFYPDKVKGEGFFISCFRKIPGSPEPEARKKEYARREDKKKDEKINEKELAIIKPFVKSMNELAFIRLNEEVIALPVLLKNELPALQSALYIKKAGIKIGRVIGNELIPDHELALSNILNENIPSVNVDKATALQYLRREEMNPGSSLKGWALVKFENIALGWIKILPNRINNYYPKEWRILMKG